MKKHLFLLTTLLVGLAACKSIRIENPDEDEQDTEESVIVSLSMQET